MKERKSLRNKRFKELYDLDFAAIFTTSFLIALSGAMMPGPLLAVTISGAARRGFWMGPLVIAGHAILELFLVVLLLLGLASLLGKEGVKIVIGMAGGLFLFYSGWVMSRDALKGRVSIDIKAKVKELLPTDVGKMPPVIAGILVSLSNPYWSMWWATIGLLYITQAMHFGILGMTSFFSGHILADLVWYSLVAAAVSGGRKFISHKIYNGILVVCGLFILALGLYFIIDVILNFI